MSYDIYISSKIKKDFNEVVDIAIENNVNIEIKTFTKTKVLDNLDRILPVYKEALRGFNGKLSMHAPFGKINPVAYNPKIREITEYRFNQAIDIAKKLDIKTIVFHSGYDRFPENYREKPVFITEFIDSETKFWTKFVKNLEKAGVLGVIENTSEKIPDILIEIANKVNSENLKLCIDTGHVNHKTQMSVIDWIKQEGSLLYYMHLHNNWEIFDDHNSLLNGTIDFKKVFDFLKKNDIYPGLSLEIPDYDATMASLNFTRKQLGL